MEVNGFAKIVYQFSEWVTRLLCVNLLWIAFTLLGFVFFGFFPATIAMFAVVRKWVIKEKDFQVFHLFWKTYKAEFVKMNGLGFFFIVAGFFLYLDMRFFPFKDGWIYIVLLVSLLGILFLYFIMVGFFFPIYVHYDFTYIQSIKYSLMIGLAAPFQSILLLVVSYFIFIISVSNPILILLFSGSSTSFLWFWISFHILLNLEKRRLKQAEGY